MEDNKDSVLATVEVAKEAKKCKCCGEYKPLSAFRPKGKGYRSICIECERKSTGTSAKFEEFTSRELIEELKARGYQGVLKKVITEEITL